MLLSLLLLSGVPAGSGMAQVKAGSVAELRRDANVERNGRVIPAVLGMPMLVGDKIETADRSSVTVSLLDGSQITLTDSASAVIDRAMAGAVKGDSMIDLFKGHLHSIVNPRPAGGLPQFVVHTPNAVAAVRGTDFETAYIAGKPCPGFPQCFRYTDVGVYKGVVEVRNPASPKPLSVRVSSGYETTVPCELPPATPGPLGMGDLSGPGYH
jgi:ferric-dicitrate binding protein FerR (iron transport regulator)